MPFEKIIICFLLRKIWHELLFNPMTCHLKVFEQNKKESHDVVETNLFIYECEYESVYVSWYRVKHVIGYTIAFSYESYRHIVYIKEIAHVTFADKGQDPMNKRIFHTLRKCKLHNVSDDIFKRAAQV